MRWTRYSTWKRVSAELIGDEEYLEPYESGLRDVEAAFIALNKLFYNDSVMIGKLSELAEVAEDRKNALTQAIVLRRDLGFQTALALVTTGEVKRLMINFGIRWMRWCLT